MEVPKGKKRPFMPEIPETPDVVEIPEQKFNFSSWIWTDRRPTQRDNISNVIVELIVKGIPKESSLVDVQLHFCLKSNGGCGDVRSVSWEPTEPDCHTKTARVTFEQETSVRTVWSFPHHINGEKLELSIVGSKQFEAPIDDPESLASEKEMAKWRKGPPKCQLPPGLTGKISTVGYLADDDMFDREKSTFPRPPKGDKNTVPMGPIRSEIDLIRHITRVAYKMSRPTAKNTKKARNAAAAGLKLELGQIREILKTEMIPKLNSIDSHLKETAAQERDEFERTKGELKGKQDKLVSVGAEMIKLRGNLSDLQAAATLAQENEKIAAVQIASLQQTVTQVSKELAESHQIRTELLKKLNAQQDQLERLTSGAARLKRSLIESETKLSLPQEPMANWKGQVARVTDAAVHNLVELNLLWDQANNASRNL